MTFPVLWEYSGGMAGAFNFYEGAGYEGFGPGGIICLHAAAFVRAAW
ncbi:hypothetical protein [Arthrobacter rhizosphaerae]|nr:hypothetical protein [Arthrobacter rhizosphaerae]